MATKKAETKRVVSGKTEPEPAKPAVRNLTREIIAKKISEEQAAKVIP